MTALNKQALRESAIHAQSNDDWGYDDDNFHDQATPATVLVLLDENERMARDLISRNGEIEGLRQRIAELEEIATDYGMKFQKAQDALKHQALLHKSQLEAAEKRIAELEARTVTLPEPFKLAKSSSGLTYYYADEVDAAIQAAGIGVKGD